MAKAGRSARWGKGALGILLTYALFLQLVFAGMLAERMAFAAAADMDPICAAAGHGSGSPGSGGDTGLAGHGQACVICAFAALSPPLPERVLAAVPTAAEAATPVGAGGEAATPLRPHHSPRSSQGPPALA
ncbi:DUF2946 family protein [Xanthobacter sp. V3C-3]|uniref:DUF2946 family protein n=1 Tax=Xanthobacter lutulentifluminis TaxID=3119935 RepID=UPI00372A1BF3